MKIESIRIENFRCFKDETIAFNNYTCFVGSNGAGKSTVLTALNVFFRQYKDSNTDLNKLSAADFHHEKVDKPIRITLTFFDLSQEAKDDLATYVRQDKLIVSAIAEYDKVKDRAEIKHNGNRMGFADFIEYFDAEKAAKKVADLRGIYSALKDKYSDLPPATTKEAMATALREYEARPLNLEKCIEIPSEDEFYGISGAGKLAPYIQWVFVSASKDVTEESEETKTSALGQLLERTVRSKINFTARIEEIKKTARNAYQTILAAEQAALDDLSASLGRRLKDWAHPDVSAQILWKQDTEKSVEVKNPWAHIKLGEKGFKGEMARFGHGLQRSYMLALLQELAFSPDVNAPTLIMGIEEPEIYQHPPQVRYLSELLQDLSEGMAQVIVCTHSPLFIPRDNLENIRMVREEGTPAHSRVSCLKYERLDELICSDPKKSLRGKGLIATIYAALNPTHNEMFFCKVLILVEGLEDVAYITSYLILNGKMNDFRRYGCHIISVGGKENLFKYIGIAKLLKVRVFVVCDADTTAAVNESVKNGNQRILTLLDHPEEDGWPANDLQFSNLFMWKTNMTEIINQDIENWNEYRGEASQHYNRTASDLEKHPLVIAYAIDKAWQNNKKSQLLERLTSSIISFAQSERDSQHNEDVEAVDRGLGVTSA